MKQIFAIIIPIVLVFSCAAQTWVDSVDQFSRTVYLPPNQFFWSWQHAPMLHAAEVQYDMMDESDRHQYFIYVKRAMDRSTQLANGTSPNAVASATGLAFLYRITGDASYLQLANQVYTDYNNSPKTSNGGVSHVTWAPELWDDTVYMIGVFFLSMYKATGDEQYIDELIFQYQAHKEKLIDEPTGLWVHGWDDNDVFNFDFCSQENWADPVTRRSHEFWGRGNGWIVVTLSELLNTLEEGHPHRNFVADELTNMIARLPEWQDETTGHWYQLPVRENEEGNFLESSCTAMFGYGMLTAMKHGLVADDLYDSNVIAAYEGLRDHSLWPIQINGNDHLTTINVCGGTCIGDKDYYFGRPVVNGEAYALAMFVIFGRAYEEMYFTDVVTDVNDFHSIISEMELYPSLIQSTSAATLKITLHESLYTSLFITDVLGRRTQLTKLHLERGEHHIKIETNDLANGSYFLSLQNESGVVLGSLQFLIQ